MVELLNVLVIAVLVAAGVGVCSFAFCALLGIFRERARRAMVLHVVVAQYVIAALYALMVVVVIAFIIWSVLNAIVHMRDGIA